MKFVWVDVLFLLLLFMSGEVFPFCLTSLWIANLSLELNRVVLQNIFKILNKPSIDLINKGQELKGLPQLIEYMREGGGYT